MDILHKLSPFEPCKYVEHRTFTMSLSSWRWRWNLSRYACQGEDHQGCLACLTPKVTLLTLFVVISSLLDAVLTLHHLEQGGSEANPIMAWALSQSPTVFMSLKMTLSGAGAVVLAAYQHALLARWALGGVVCGYGALLLVHLALVLGGR